MSSRSASWDEALAGTLAGLCLVLALAALLFMIWLTVKTIQLLIRVFSAHPTNRALLGALIASLLFVFLALVTNGQVQAIDALAGMSVALLLGIALVLDTADDARLRRPFSRDTAVHAVLHEWWPAA
jgi:hypothetical protein